MLIIFKKHAVVFLLPLLVAISVNAYAADKKIKGTRGYIEERYKPVEPYKGPTRSGKTVYSNSCATCHDRTTQGAPLPDDDVEWGKRIKKGKKILLKNVMNGYKELMPVKGGCRNCTEKEILAAINYILITSGVEDSAKK